MEMNTTSGELQNPSVYGEAGKLEIIASISFTTYAILILVSNVFVLMVLHQARKRFDEIMRLLIQTLAVSDLMGGFSCCLLHILYFMFKTFSLSVGICKLLPLFSMYMILKSLYCLCLINLYKCISLLYPLTYRRYLSLRRVRIIVLLLKIGVFGCVMPLLPIEGKGFDRVLEYMCHFTDSRDRTPDVGLKSNMTVIGAVIVTELIIPVIILTATNIKLLIIGCKAAKRVAKSKLQSDQHLMTASSTGSWQLGHQGNALNVRENIRFVLGFKGTRTILTITCMLYLSCVPFCSLVVSSIMDQEGIVESVTMVTAFIFLLSNAWWNALIFLFTSKTFREEAIKLKNSLIKGMV